MYLETTFEERLTEYWAHTYQDDPKLMEVAEDETFDVEAIQQQWAEEAEMAQQADALNTGPAPDGAGIDINAIDDWEDVNGN